MTSRTGQRVDTGEQLLPCRDGQIDQKTFGDPRRRLRRVETTVPQRLRPILAEVDGDLTAFGVGHGALLAQHLALEIENLRTIQFEDRRRIGPGQPGGARVQTGGQDHHLPYAGVCGPPEVVVEVSGTCTLVVDEMLPPVRGFQRMFGELAVEYVSRGSTYRPAEPLGE